MNKEARFAWLRDSMAVVTGAFLLTTSVAGSTASAGDNQRGWTTISGTAAPSLCAGETVLALQLHGDLEGCWSIFPERFECDELNGFDLYREWGREEFEGTRDGEPGRFVTRYTFEGAYAPGFCSSFDFVTELAGGCDHYVRGRSGAFRGVVGHIQFFDVIPGISTDGFGTITPGNSGPTDYFYVGKVNR